MNKTDYKRINLEKIKKTALRKLLRDVVSDLKEQKPDFRNWLAENFLGNFIIKLFGLKWYKEICKLAEQIPEDQIWNVKALFEIAYSFGEIDNLQKSESFYEAYLLFYGESSAVCNNLGLIYEKGGGLESALECFEKAKTLDPRDDISPRNYKRVKKLLLEKETEKQRLKKALGEFKAENSYIKEKFLKFCRNAGGDGLVTCPYRQLPQFMGVSANKAHEIINNWLSSNYLNKVNTEGISVYEINPYIQEYLVKLEAELKQDREFLKICERLDSKSLEQIGFDACLQNKLSEKIIDDELKDMLTRDIKEAAIAVLTQSYKSALVLSGSIIEAILLDRLKHLGIKKVQIKTKSKTTMKKLQDLNLNELLYEAKKQCVIDASLMHFSHGVRGFRNLIHPGVEYRKKGLKVSKDNAELAWTVVKKLVFEISEP